jgi:hypothetical protein
MGHRNGWFGLILVALAVSSASACSDQGEGQRCDKNSGDSDCAAGLVCTPYRGTTTTGTGGSTPGELGQYVCCPQNGSATTVACTATSTNFDAGPSTGGSSARDGGSTGGSSGAGGSSGSGGTGGEGGMHPDAASGGAADLDAGRKDAQ